MMKRYAALVVVAVLAAAHDVYACRSFLGNPDTVNDPTTYKDNLNVDLSDYGVIFEEAAPWSGCTQAAADALYRKLYTTFNPTIVGRAPWPHTAVNIEGSFGPFQGWLSGGDVALIQATALRLANVGKLSKPLDDLVQRVSTSYRLSIDKNCGFDGLVYNEATNSWIARWREQNSCMEDYTIGAMGHAWTAAYRYKRGVLDPSQPAADARTAISDSLSTTSSVCAWNGSTNINPAPPRGPCTGTVNDLRYNNYIPVSMHAGDSMPYGVGLFTSIASAAVALKVADRPLTLNPDEQLVAQKLYQHGRNHTAPDHSTFFSDCYRFELSGGAVQAIAGSNCGDNNTGYHPEMFPVADFVGQYAPPSASNPGFNSFNPYLFCDNPVGRGAWGDCFFYNPGRRSVYGQMGQTWIQNPPVFNNTGLGDYTVSFRTVNGNYLSASYGGGSSVNAAPGAAGPDERFSLMIRTANRTALYDGDQITLQTTTYNNGHWFVAEDGGGAGSVLNANRLYPSSWETFTIHKLNGTGAINNGDQVALRSIGGYYVSAMNGGGSTVTVDRTAALSWETFTISLTHN